MAGAPWGATTITMPCRTARRGSARSDIERRPMDPVERLSKLQQNVRRDLLRVLTAESDVRADLIRQLRDRGDDDLVDVLADLEANDALREQVIDVLRASLRAE